MLHPLRSSRLDPRLALVLLVGLLHGLLYVFLVPPWEHYDEPGHFEYAWLAANRADWPQPGDYDSAMRRELGASLVETGFTARRGMSINLLTTAEPVWVGVTQIGDPPLYYFLASIPLRFMRFTRLVSQLYTARLVSLLFFLACLFAAWGLMRELLPARHPLVWMTPLSLALLPAFTDLMTSVNNDVAAVTCFSWFLWGAVRLIRRGFNAVDLLWCIAAAITCLLAKTTVYVAIPLLVAAGLLAFLRSLRLSLALIAASALILAAAIFSLNGAWDWGSSSFPGEARGPATYTRTYVPLGQRVLAIQGASAGRPWRFFQYLPRAGFEVIAGKQATLGFWAWADQPAQVESPAFVCSTGREVTASFRQNLSLTVEPQFFAFSFAVPASCPIALVEFDRPIENLSPAAVSFDGLLLLPGARPAAGAPTFDRASGTSGEWGGQRFTNLLRNPSFETRGPALRGWVFARVSALSGTVPAYFINNTLDVRGNDSFYSYALVETLRKFWAKFGWGGVGLTGDGVYNLLLSFTLIGGAGFVVLLARARKHISWKSAALLALSVGVVAGLYLVRYQTDMPDYAPPPVARYIYPAVIPLITAVTAGWYALLNPLACRLRVSRRVWMAVYFALWLALDGISIYTWLANYTS